MKHRSPRLGYNHNIRYGGRMYHVQTEDSGISNPHIFTHLFHEGTILSSKRVDYEIEADDVTVQNLMQTQHKMMLRDLRDGMFDVKIAQFFGERISARRTAGPDRPPAREAEETRDDATPVDMNLGNLSAAAAELEAQPTDRELAEAASAAETLANAASLPLDEVSSSAGAALYPDLLDDTIPVELIDLDAPIVPGVPDVPAPLPARARYVTPPRGSRMTPSRAQVAAASPVPGVQAPPAQAVPPEAQRPRSSFDLPPPAGSALAQSPGAPSLVQDIADPPHLHSTPARVAAVPSAAPRRSQGVVVTRSVVVGVGGGSHTAPSGPQRRPSLPPTAIPVIAPPIEDPAAYETGVSPAATSDPSIFGEDAFTDKSLDEVILAYLAEDAEK